MSDEVRQCLQILEEAIKFEEEGMRFFNDQAQNSSSPLERRIFQSLVKDEAGHKAYLVGLRDELTRTTDLAALPADDQPHRSAREIFETSLEAVKEPYAAEAEELEILRGAMEVEKRGYTLYRSAADRMESPRARELFVHLAEEEQNHYQLLSNTFECLRDPAQWHGFDESPMLDGG